MTSPLLTPTTVAAPHTAPDDLRLGHLLAGAEADDLQVVLVGFPSDEGVRRNGGRPGARRAPQAVRERLYRLTPDPRRPAMAQVLRRTADLGDVVVTGDVDADQERLGAVLAPWLRRGVVPIVLGGGHETAYGHFLGYVEAERDVAILNWDAHADVRPVGEHGAHSGSPFRQALEHASGRCLGYRVAGLLPYSTAAAHLAFLEAHGAEVVWREALDDMRVDALYARAHGPTMTTFDIDAVDGGAAPGVSAPATDGLPAALWLYAAESAGRSPAVASMDVVELNPDHDLDGRTARLAALTVWHALRGLSERG